MQREQLELVESVKQQRDSISKQKENAVSDKEIGSIANNQQSIFRKPPYPIELFYKPYPKNYKTPIFVRYDGRKGNTIEHVSKFLDTMGQHAGNEELCLREFSKSPGPLRIGLTCGIPDSHQVLSGLGMRW